MRQKNRLRWIGVILVVGVLGITWWATQGGQASDVDVSRDQPNRGLPVDVLDLGGQSELHIPRTYAGMVKPEQSSRLGFELAGRVDQVFVDQGDRVTSGQLLAQLDQRRLIAQRDQFSGELRAAEALLKELVAGPRPESLKAAQARVDQLQAQLQLARIKFERRQSLLRDSAASQEELDVQRYEVAFLEAQLAEASADWDELNNGTRAEQIAAQQATVERLQAALEQAEIEISHTQLFAPFDGQIVSRNLEVGDIAAKGESVLELESTRREVWIGCPPETTKQLRQGSKYTVRVLGEECSATLRSIVEKLDAKTRTQTLVFDLASASEQTPSGAVARLSVQENLDSKGFWVPASSLVSGTQGLWAAYVVMTDDTGQSTLVRRDVELLHLEDDAAFVRGTLNAGDTIVASGVHRLVAGQRVTPQVIQWSYAGEK